MMTTVGDRPAAASGTFALGGDLPVHSLGFGAIQLTGPGVWGEPPQSAPSASARTAPSTGSSRTPSSWT
jgi:hypothetical protein